MSYGLKEGSFYIQCIGQQDIRFLKRVHGYFVCIDNLEFGISKNKKGSFTVTDLITGSKVIDIESLAELKENEKEVAIKVREKRNTALYIDDYENFNRLFNNEEELD